MRESALCFSAEIHPFPPSFARGACSFGKCARRILEVTLGKSAILPRFITLLGCSVTLPHYPYPQKFTSSALIRSPCLLIRKMRTAHFRGDACKNAVLPRLILSKNRKGKGSTAYRCSGLFVFCLFEGKTRPAPLLFSPLSAASCARARYALPRKFTPFRLRCAPCKAVALLKVRSPKSAIFGGGN